MLSDFEKIVKFSGTIFMFISALLFYNHLYTAFGNPGFYVVVYFDAFGEGMLEIVLFTFFIPFILFSVIMEFKGTIKSRESIK